MRRWRHDAPGADDAGQTPPGRFVVVTNNTYQAAPWADVLFAMDSAWWTHYAHHVRRDRFAGELLTCSQAVRVDGVAKIPTDGIQNSGAGAIMVATLRGASRVILLGYDCQKSPGRAHWHADHPRGLGNAGSVGKWPQQFAALLPRLRVAGVEVVNASRATALGVFPRAKLEDVLCRM